jgi:hypothetical protein
MDELVLGQDGRVQADGELDHVPCCSLALEPLEEVAGGRDRLGRRTERYEQFDPMTRPEHHAADAVACALRLSQRASSSVGFHPWCRCDERGDAG